VERPHRSTEIDLGLRDGQEVAHGGKVRLLKNLGQLFLTKRLMSGQQYVGGAPVTKKTAS